MARLIDQVVGHKNQLETLLTSAEENKLPHAFLFVGASGIGKKQVALAMAQALICEKSVRACGVCSSCKRFAQGHHENFLQIKPEKNQIKIDQSRGILDFLSLKAIRGRRVIVIDDAESLNPQAANSLLKILEEPHEEVFFFLIAPGSVHVLSTIKSRTQVIHFKPLTIEELKQRSKAPEWALRASQGSFEKLAMLQDSDEQVLRDKAKKFLSIWLKEPHGYLNADLRETFKDRSEGSSLSLYLAMFLRDAVYVKEGHPEKAFNQDQQGVLKELSNLSADKLLSTSQKALQIPNHINSNRDPALVFEDFWIQSFNS